MGVDAKTGRFLWRHDKTVSKYGANIPTPVSDDGRVYSAGAGTGGGLVRLTVGGAAAAADPVYFSPKLPTAVGGAVKVGGFLYGTSAQAMLCADFNTGDVKWEERALGAAALCYAEGRLYLTARTATSRWWNQPPKVTARRAVSLRLVSRRASTRWRRPGRIRWWPTAGSTSGTWAFSGVLTSARAG